MLVLAPTTDKHLGLFMISAYAPSFDASKNDQLDFENVLPSAFSVVILVMFSLFAPMPMISSASVILNVMILTYILLSALMELIMLIHPVVVYNL
jgi:hypothetical protein